jgi:hypothetical protein
MYFSRYFANETALTTHKTEKPHKRRLKALEDTPYTQKEAEAASGLGSYEQFLPTNVKGAKKELVAHVLQREANVKDVRVKKEQERCDKEAEVLEAKRTLVKVKEQEKKEKQKQKKKTIV